MWNLFISITLLSLFRYFALPTLSAKSTVEIAQYRIFYASFADSKNFPFAVPLSILKNKSHVFSCSASLLTTKFILTAAHCLEKNTTYYVGLGDQNKHNQRNYVESKSYLIHEKYKSKDELNMFDIGLIELLKAIEPGTFGTPVKLPSKSDTNQTYMGYKAIACGWGATKHDKFNTKLKFLNLTIITNDKCPFNIKSNDVICGMGENFGRVCHGDSGGPLVIQNAKNETIQIGIVSFGQPNCRRGFGSFYTRVTQFLDWIEKNSDYKFQ